MAKLPRINLNFGKAPRYANLKYPLGKKVTSYSPGINSESTERIYYMRPHEYLAMVSPLDDDAKKVTIRPGDAFTQKRVDYLAKRMKAGRNFEPLMVSVKEGSYISAHEGRHRAMAAQQIGVKEVPVYVGSVMDYPYGAFDKTKIKRQGYDVAKAKYIRSMNDEKDLENTRISYLPEKPAAYSKKIQLSGCEGDLCYEYVQRNKKPGDKILMQSFPTDDASREGHVAILRDNEVREFMPGEGERIMKKEEYSQTLDNQTGERITGAENLFKEIPEEEFKARIPKKKEPEAESKEYAGSEEEMNEELESLYGKD